MGRPVVFISRCLGFAACRYDGTAVKNQFVRRLKKKVRFIAFCPEVEIGLGVPRAPVRIVMNRGAHRLIQPATGLDLTKKMANKCRQVLGALTAVDGFILKSKSPSCGLHDARVYAYRAGDRVVGRSSGLFAAAVRRRFKYLPMIDEKGLKNRKTRTDFLRRLPLREI